MKRSRKDIELLSPAGSYESLTAAAQGGADAVYFGIGELNMRARSSTGFGPGDLPVIVSRAHESGMKAYLAVNTVVYDGELERMRSLIDLAADRGVDAVIATDQSVLQYCRNRNMRVHLSTQLNISNIESLRFYSEYADAVVLARELDLDQVGEIVNAVRRDRITGPSGALIRIEMFVHGALCMAISGKCYLSLHAHNHSANRGDCFQVCRRGYRVMDRDREVELDIDNAYIMSPKDLKTIHFLNKILDRGIGILKIEGRARSAEYVKSVTSCYSEAIGAWAEGAFTADRIREWDSRLRRVFNRGFWDGYYLGKRLGEWSHGYGSRATRRKVYVGRGTNYFERIGVAEVLIESDSLGVGDEILITGPTTGVIETSVKQLRVNGKDSITASKGETCSFPVDQIVRRSDKLYKLVARSESGNAIF